MHTKDNEAHDNAATQMMGNDADNNNVPRRRQQSDKTMQRDAYNGQQCRQWTTTQSNAATQTTGTMQTTTTRCGADDKISVSRSRRRIRLIKDPFDVKLMFIK